MTPPIKTDRYGRYPCKDCGEYKPKSKFNKCSGTASGLDYRCRECDNEKTRKDRERRSKTFGNTDYMRKHIKQATSHTPVNSRSRAYELVKDPSDTYSKGMRFSNDELFHGLPMMNFENGTVFVYYGHKRIVENNRLLDEKGREAKVE